MREDDTGRVPAVKEAAAGRANSAYVRLPPSPSRSYAMGMPAQHTEWTAEMVRALPDDGKRYEVLDGQLLVSPAPRWSHQGIVLELALRLRPYVERHRLGRLLIAPAEIEFSPRDLVEPDLFIVPDRGRGRPQAWDDVRQSCWSWRSCHPPRPTPTAHASASPTSAREFRSTGSWIRIRGSSNAGVPKTNVRMSSPIASPGRPGAALRRW